MSPAEVPKVLKIPRWVNMRGESLMCYTRPTIDPISATDTSHIHHTSASLTRHHHLIFHSLRKRNSHIKISCLGLHPGNNGSEKRSRGRKRLRSSTQERGKPKRKKIQFQNDIYWVESKVSMDLTLSWLQQRCQTQIISWMRPVLHGERWILRRPEGDGRWCVRQGGRWEMVCSVMCWRMPPAFSAFFCCTPDILPSVQSTV